MQQRSASLCPHQSHHREPVDPGGRHRSHSCREAPEPIHIDRGLVERNFGSFNGLVIHEVKAQHGLRSDQSSRDILPPEADPFCEIFDRIPPVVAKWMTSHADELLLFIGHRGVFDWLHHYMFGPRIGRESSHAIPFLANPTSNGWELSPVALVTQG